VCSIQDTIDARDGAVATLQTEVNTLASSIDQRSQQRPCTGFSLTGSTGEKFIYRTNASDIQSMANS